MSEPPPAVTDAQPDQPTPAQAFQPRTLALRLILPTLAFLLCLLFANPEALGAFQDDALYHSIANGLSHSGFDQHCQALPGHPAIAKYPPLYSLTLWLALRLGAPFLIQAAIVAAAFALFEHILARHFTLPLRARALIILPLLVNAQTLQVFSALMSEGLYLLIFLAQIDALLRLEENDQSPSPKLWYLGATIALGQLCRSANLLFAPAFALWFLYKRRFLNLLPLALALAIALALQSSLRAQAQAHNEKLSQGHRQALAYYLDYGYHLDFYRNPGQGSALSRLGTVVAHNGPAGLRSLSASLAPSDLPLPGPLRIGLGALLLTFGGLGLWRTHRALALLMIPYIAVLCAWTWIFSPRFWIPLLPLLWLGLHQLCQIRKPLTSHLFSALAIFCILTQSLASAQLLLSRQPLAPAKPPKTKAEREAYEFEQHLDRLKEELQRDRGDIIVGGFDALWIGHRCQTPALWLTALQSRDAVLSQSLSIPAVKAQPELAWQKLQALRQSQPQGARLLLHLDPSSSAAEIAIIKTWLRQRRLRVIRQGRRFSLLTVVR